MAGWYSSMKWVSPFNNQWNEILMCIKSIHTCMCRLFVTGMLLLGKQCGWACVTRVNGGSLLLCPRVKWLETPPPLNATFYYVTLKGERGWPGKHYHCVFLLSKFCQNLMLGSEMGVTWSVLALCGHIIYVDSPFLTFEYEFGAIWLVVDLPERCRLWVELTECAAICCCVYCNHFTWCRAAII